MTTKTKHYLRHALSVGAMAFMWVEILDLLDGIETTHAISGSWRIPCAVLAVAVAIGVTIYVLVTQIPLLARIHKRELEAGK